MKYTDKMYFYLCIVYTMSVTASNLLGLIDKNRNIASKEVLLYRIEEQVDSPMDEHNCFFKILLYKPINLSYLQKA